LILITGATGMLGQEVANLLGNNHQFNVDEILTPSRAELNLEDGQSCINYLKKYKPKIVIHLAAKVMGLKGNLELQAESLIKNSLINSNLYSAMLNYLPEKIFFAGTAASYAYPFKSLPLREDLFLKGDVHEGEFGYAWAKRLSYPWLRIFREEFGVKVVYGVLTNLFGPNDRFRGSQTHVIPALINRANVSKSAGGNSLDVWGFPSTTRDFLFSGEAAKVIIHLILGPEINDNSILVNIGSGVETPMSSVASIIAREFALGKVNWLHDKPIGVSRRYLNIDKLNGSGITVNHDFDGQLTSTINWYMNNLGRLR